MQTVCAFIAMCVGCDPGKRPNHGKFGKVELEFVIIDKVFVENLREPMRSCGGCFVKTICHLSTGCSLHCGRVYSSLAINDLPQTHLIVMLMAGSLSKER